MPEIKILEKSTAISILSLEENSLLRDLQENGFDIYSPFGGNGTFGKCKVFVKGEGDFSGTGAFVALKSVQYDQVIQEIRNRSCYLELSEDEDFVQDYAMNMDSEI
jgi:uncharacterized 2Fe-2S/4Fe-4S cluster protein (DUF4445 family)